MTNILRGNRVKRSSRKANDFTSSIGFDAPLAKHVVKINMAHMLSLMGAREVDQEIGRACLSFLSGLPEEMVLDPSTEDVHHMVEQEAIRVMGMERAGYLNLGKSRNDQVATALRMEVRERLLQVAEAIRSLQSSVVGLMRRYGRLAMPGYTHLQHAQPVTVAHHLQAYFDAFGRDVERIQQAYSRINRSPMGGAALAGTSFAIDRNEVASLLGFDGVIENAMDAVSSRDFALEALTCCEMTMVNLSRLAEELILWSSGEFGFVELADEHSATSSIMPQKKNPVVAETVRAKCGSVIGSCTAAFAIVKALPNSYNIDLQEVTPHLWSALSDTFRSVDMMAGVLSALKFNGARMDELLTDDKSTATELANYLVRKAGLPFRQAHAVVGEVVRDSLERGLTLSEAVADELPRVSEKTAGRPIRLSREELSSVLDPIRNLAMIKSVGGANPKNIPKMLRRDSASMERGTRWAGERRASLREAERRLAKGAEGQR